MHRILRSDKDSSMAYLGPLLIVIWHADTLMDAIEDCDRFLSELASSRRQGIGLLTIVEAKASLPGSQERSRLAQMLANHSESIKASALVFEGEGFGAAAVRSVVVGLNLLARQPYPHKVFATIETAAGWMAPQVPADAQRVLERNFVISGVAKLRANLLQT